VEVSSGITKVWAEVIPNKTAAVLLAIIKEHVIDGSTVYTDEHRSYIGLAREGYVHGTVCHKYNFVERATGVHTQHVESFNNALKLEIKTRKGVKTELRQAFLTSLYGSGITRIVCWKNCLISLKLSSLFFVFL
jgi:transposase-like protein